MSRGAGSVRTTKLWSGKKLLAIFSNPSFFFNFLLDIAGLAGESGVRIPEEVLRIVNVRT
jgi:hypothetical protein